MSYSRRTDAAAGEALGPHRASASGGEWRPSDDGDPYKSHYITLSRGLGSGDGTPSARTKLLEIVPKAFAEHVTDKMRKEAQMRHRSNDIMTKAGEVQELKDVVRSGGGRETPEEITLFKSLGVGLEDVAVGALIYERARERSVGIVLDL